MGGIVMNIDDYNSMLDKKMSELSNKLRNRRYITFETVFWFGKYYGEQVEDVCHDDPEYMQWLIKTDSHDFDDEVIDLVEMNL